jgi:hypothetical protein
MVAHCLAARSVNFGMDSTFIALEVLRCEHNLPKARRRNHSAGFQQCSPW